MKERGLSTCYKIKLVFCTPGLFATTDDHEGFTLVRLIDKTQEVAVSRTQHLLFYYGSQFSRDPEFLETFFVAFDFLKL